MTKEEKINYLIDRLEEIGLIKLTDEKPKRQSEDD